MGIAGGNSKKPFYPMRFRSWSWQLVALSGIILIVAGISTCAIAGMGSLLPYDVHFLGMTRQHLCEMHGCRIVHFMIHDRVSFGGSIIAVGLVYVWLASQPLARGERWAWWALLFSGAIGFASFLTYLGFGYFDLWHGRATMVLLLVFVAGMIRSHSILASPLRGPRAPLAQRALWGTGQVGGWGRRFLLFTALGMILAGATIMALGMTSVFVPQDLEFMRVPVDELRRINPRLVPLIAHDRAGFGGGLCSTGAAILWIAWCAVVPGDRTLWWVLLGAGAVGFGCAIGIHPVVGYLSFSHLLPALVGAGTFSLSIALLWKPMA